MAIDLLLSIGFGLLVVFGIIWISVSSKYRRLYYTSLALSQLGTLLICVGGFVYFFYEFPKELGTGIIYGIMVSIGLATLAVWQTFVKAKAMGLNFLRAKTDIERTISEKEYEKFINKTTSPKTFTQVIVGFVILGLVIPIIMNWSQNAVEVSIITFAVIFFPLYIILVLILDRKMRQKSPKESYSRKEEPQRHKGKGFELDLKARNQLLTSWYWWFPVVILLGLILTIVL